MSSIVWLCSCYSRLYNWATLWALIWSEWGTCSVLLNLGLLWEMWLADFKSQHVRAPGLCQGCEQPSWLHCVIRLLFLVQNTRQTSHFCTPSGVVHYCIVAFHTRGFPQSHCFVIHEKQNPSSSRFHITNVYVICFLCCLLITAFKSVPFFLQEQASIWNDAFWKNISTFSIVACQKISDSAVKKSTNWD